MREPAQNTTFEAVQIETSVKRRLKVACAALEMNMKDAVTRSVEMYLLELEKAVELEREERAKEEQKQAEERERVQAELRADEKRIEDLGESLFGKFKGKSWVKKV